MGVTILLVVTRAMIGLMISPRIPPRLPTMLRPRENGAREEKAAPNALRNLVRCGGGDEEKTRLPSTPRTVIATIGLVTRPLRTPKMVARGPIFCPFLFFPSSKRTNPIGLRMRREIGATR